VQDGAGDSSDFSKEKSGIFLMGGLDSTNVLPPVGQISCQVSGSSLGTLPRANLLYPTLVGFDRAD
jgi:hypothetical protein